MTRSRWTIPLILAVTVFVHYLDRNNLAIVLPQVAREFGWDNRQIGQYGNLLLGAFYCDLRRRAGDSQPAGGAVGRQAQPDGVGGRAFRSARCCFIRWAARWAR
jgi:hypothetical protein